jgi:hypothetical protein
VTARQTLIRSNKGEALKRWTLCAILVFGSAYAVYLGIADGKMRWTLIGAVGLLFFSFFFIHYLRYVLISRVFLVLDEQGVHSASGKVRVRWDEVEHFYFDRSRTLIALVALTKQGEEVVFPTGSVVAIEEATARLEEYGAKVLG